MGAMRAGAGQRRDVLVRSPVPELPGVHKIVLPTPFDVASVQAYVLEGDPLTLVDVGVRSAESRRTLESALEALGHGLEDIGRVVVTHAHRDHMGQIQSLRDAGVELEVWAHEADAPLIEGYSVEADELLRESAGLFLEYGVPAEVVERHTAWRRARIPQEQGYCEPTAVDRALVDGERVSFKDFELRVVHAPGHTPGHLLLHDEEHRVLFTGDHIMGSGTVPAISTHYLPDPTAVPDPSDPAGRRPRFQGLVEYLRSLRKLRGTAYRYLLPGCGGVIRRTARAIDDTLLFYDVRIQRIERGLRKLAAMGQPVTGWDLLRALYPELELESQLRLPMMVVIGSLDELEARGQVRTERGDDGVLVHRHS